MDRATLHDHLSQARARVALGQEHIERQRAIIGDLEMAGTDATLAVEFLRTFEQSQDMHLADLVRLEEELAALDRQA